MDRRSALKAGFAGADIAHRLSSEAFLEALLASSHEAIICKDGAGRIISWNAGAEQLYGYAAAEILGQPLTRLVPPALAQEALARFQQALREGRVDRVRTRRRRKDGSEFPSELSLRRIAVANGDVVLSMVRDESDRERVETLLYELKRAQEIAQLGSWQWDARNNCATYSDEALRLHGLPPGRQSTYESFIAAVVPEDRARVAATVLEAVQTRRSCAFEFRLQRPDGKVRWLHSELRVETDADDRPLRLYGTDQDITDKKEAEEALRRSEERFRYIARATSDTLYDLDIGPGTLWLGKGGLLGHASEEISSYEAFVQHIHPDDRRQTIGHLQGVIASRDGNLFSAEYRLRRKDGSYAHVHGRGFVIRNAAGRALRMVGGITDLTERIEAQHRLATEAQRLARSNEELERFGYVVSHDLQEPLRTLTSYTQLLVRRYGSDDAPAAREYAGYVADAVARMRDMIDGLLAYARISHHGLEVKATDFNAVLDAVEASLGAAIAESGAVIHRQVLPTLPADGRQMHQLFQNLIGNAIKFRRGEAPCITVEARESGEEWHFTVQDNGIGIEPRFAERIFVLFQRLHPRDVYPGSGIGLAICKKIVEAHGGRIGIEPTAIGTRFGFSLPTNGPPV